MYVQLRQDITVTAEMDFDRYFTNHSLKRNN